MKAIHSHHCIRCIQVQLPQTYDSVWVRLHISRNRVQIFGFHDQHRHAVQTVKLFHKLIQEIRTTIVVNVAVN